MRSCRAHVWGHVWGIMAIAVALAADAAEESKLEGWVTKVDRSGQTIEVDGHTVQLSGLRVVGGGRLVPGAFVSVDRGRIRVKEQQRPLYDQVSRFPAKKPDNPGRSEFSHLRHFGAIGDKKCQACHSPEMGLLTTTSYASRTTAPGLEPHAPGSLGRFCAACHNGTTRLSEAGTLEARLDAPIFTASRTGDSKSCERCHAPTDHRVNFTLDHGKVAERSGLHACGKCHALDWAPRDRRLQASLLAAERTLEQNPDDPDAALAVGPNNFCVYCHRVDEEWAQK